MYLLVLKRTWYMSGTLGQRINTSASTNNRFIFNQVQVKVQVHGHQYVSPRTSTSACT